MKNKKLAYILLTLAVIIWGLILYRILNFAKKEDTISINFNYSKSKINTTIKHDSVILIANYPDPFLDEYKSYNRNSELTTFNSISNTEIIDKTYLNVKNTKTIQWPTIVYNGVIFHKASGKTVGLANFNDNELIIYPDSSYLGVYIYKLFSDSMLVSIQKEKKIIRKQ